MHAALGGWSGFTLLWASTVMVALGSVRPGPDPVDLALIARIKSGDTLALRSLYTRLSGRVMALALKVLGSKPEAEDVVQDTFVTIWRRASTFDPARGSAASWIFGIARHRAIDVLRARPVERSAGELTEALAGASDDGSPLEDVTQRELRQRIVSALGTLTTEQRHAIELAYYKGLSQSEIAEATGAPLGTIKGRIRDGMAKLAVILDPKDLTP